VIVTVLPSAFVVVSTTVLGLLDEPDPEPPCIAGARVGQVNGVGQAVTVCVLKIVVVPADFLAGQVP